MGKQRKLKIKSTSPIDFREFKAFLKFLPEPVRLVTRFYKFASEVYAGVGLLYYWKEVFCLPADAVYQPERGPCQVVLYRSSSYGTQGEAWFGHYVPDNLAGQLLKLSQSNKGGLLFQRKDGSAFDSKWIEQEFRKASKLAIQDGVIKYPITPIHLKTTPKSKIKFQPGCYPAKLLKDHPEAVRTVSEEKIQEIAKILTMNSKNSGRPREHSLHDICKALLAQEDFKLSRVELVEHFSDIARAAESQKRRWIKDEIWSQILLLLKS